MAGKRKKTKRISPVQKLQSEMAERKEGLKAEKVVLGNCRLPLEMCQHLFKKLDSEEKITFSRALIPWHELVTKEMPLFLCPKGAPILIEHLPQKAMLQCRQLTRSWTQEQDQHYQDHPVHVRLPFEMACCGKKQIPKLINCFRSAEAIQKFLNDMKDHPGNPFPGSNVKLLWRGFPADLETEFWSKALQLCKRFGNHVYYVKFVGIKLQCLRKFLVKLPNLKGLTISELSGNTINNCLSLPQLRNLQMLEMQFASKAFINAVLDSCPIPKNMKRLSIDTNANFRIPEIVYSFVNLEVLQTRLDIIDLQRFGNLPRLPPLREIEFDFHTPVATHQVFKMLEPFANTLIHFKGWLMTSCDHLTWMNTDISLPNLRKLNVRGFTGSLDSFINLKSLADLTVTLDPPRRIQLLSMGTQWEFNGFKEPLKDTKIWTRIPSLKRLTVGNTIYYRPLPPKQNRRSKRKCVLNAKRYF